MSIIHQSNLKARLPATIVPVGLRHLEINQQHDGPRNQAALEVPEKKPRLHKVGIKKTKNSKVEFKG